MGIAPDKKIGSHVHKTQLETHEMISGSGVCINEGAEIRYEPGVIYGADISLTRLEYGALCYLAASPGRVFTRAQILEAVWSMESESCQSNVANVICNLRKKIEPDSQTPPT